ncbi:hypothetical protein [Escherichia coli]|uniref:hypothetical protein n=1 Tax=Escherichia coli TaxID=562 RepID=UPI0015E218DB|nr:hypothetical protein [Escherichia coli]ELE6989488.1 hypothetical protein [Enterobacter kobei]ELH6606724.1 hypothetical protein [Escherichia coli]MBA1057014.1 hypothetical protein [Escherichia coli]MDA6490781.1 hypothetical protein [Escherichia coli]
MSLSKGKNEDYRLKIKTKRELSVFYWFVMENKSMIDRYRSSPLKNMKRINSIYRMNIRDASLLLSEVVSDYYSGVLDAILHYEGKIEIFLDSLLPESEFEWFRKNEHACYFVWLSIKKHYPQLSSEMLNIQQEVAPQKFSNVHSLVGLSGLDNFSQNIQHAIASEPFLSEINSLHVHPASHKERYNSILYFMDLVPSYFIDKLSFIKNIRSQWDVKFKAKRKLNIPVENTGLCQWAWDYMKNKPSMRKRVYIQGTEAPEGGINLSGEDYSLSICSADDKDGICNKNMSESTAQEDYNKSANNDADNDKSSEHESGIKKVSYKTIDLSPENGSSLSSINRIGWHDAFEIIQPSTPRETYLAIHAVWIFYVGGTFLEPELYNQFKRARDTYLTRKRKKIKIIRNKLQEMN